MVDGVLCLSQSKTGMLICMSVIRIYQLLVRVLFLALLRASIKLFTVVSASCIYKLSGKCLNLLNQTAGGF